jgi:hypothetical protein
MTDNTEFQKNANSTPSAPATTPPPWRRPSQWSIFGFRFVPLLLFAAGTCGIIYGAFYHRIPVTETHAEEDTTPEPPPPQVTQNPWDAMSPDMPPEMGLDKPPGWPPFQTPPDFSPPKNAEKRIRKVKTTTNELEIAVNLAVSEGALERTKTNEIARISNSVDNGDVKKGPARCKT